jgi:O-methyltransferase
MDWKQYFRRFLNSFDYDIVRSSRAGASDYINCPPYSYKTHAPWFGDEFQALYKKVASNTVVKEDRCYILHGMARYASGLPGDVAECGVFRGGTAFIIADALRHSGKTLRLYDTFSGMPDGTETDPSGHCVGDFGGTSLEAVQAYLSEFPLVEYCSGVIPDTFNYADDSPYCLIHVDVDLYQSVYDCCEYFYERLIPGGVMIFDDYGFEKYIHAGKKAVDEFFKDKPEVPIALRSGQCILIKLPTAN